MLRGSSCIVGSSGALHWRIATTRVAQWLMMGMCKAVPLITRFLHVPGILTWRFVSFLLMPDHPPFHYSIQQRPSLHNPLGDAEMAPLSTDPFQVAVLLLLVVFLVVVVVVANNTITEQAFIGISLDKLLCINYKEDTGVEFRVKPDNSA